MSEQLEALSTRELMARLPPVEDAPILEKLGTLGLVKFRDEYAIETPTFQTGERKGIVDHVALVKKVSGFVSRDYLWHAPFFDEHHLHWSAKKFSSDLAIRFRNLPIHKLWIPREFHEFTHVMTAQTDVPSDEVMQLSIDEYLADDHLFQLTNEVTTLRERIDHSIPYPKQPGHLLVPDSSNSRRLKMKEEGMMERRRMAFIEEIQAQIETSPGLNLSILSRLELLNAETIETVLPSLRREMSVRVAKTNRRRPARAVKLPIAPKIAA